MGVATFLGVMAGVSAVANIWGAHKQSKSAKEAAATQEKAVDKAMDYEQKRLDQYRADQQPFRDFALNQLAGLQSGANTFTPNFSGLPTPQQSRAAFPMDRAVPGLTRTPSGARMGGGGGGFSVSDLAQQGQLQMNPNFRPAGSGPTAQQQAWASAPPQQWQPQTQDQPLRAMLPPEYGSQGLAPMAQA